MKTLTNRPTLTLTRLIDAPCELVFQAWTEPKHLARWWGPAEFTNPVCEIDVRPGGAILIHMRSPTGEVYPMSGVFVEVADPERLVFTHSALEDEEGNPALEAVSTVTFQPRGGKTLLTLHTVVVKTEPAAALALSGMEEGWNQSFDRLATLVESDL